MKKRLSFTILAKNRVFFGSFRYCKYCPVIQIDSKISCSLPITYSCFYWIVSLRVLNRSLRMSSGLFSLAASFMLVMIVDNNRDLLLNFTAVAFISYLDDAIFLLGEIAKAVMRRAS